MNISHALKHVTSAPRDFAIKYGPFLLGVRGDDKEILP